MMKTPIILSKLMIVGKVDINTPWVVLDEILKSYNYEISYEKLKCDEKISVMKNNKNFEITVKDNYVLSIIKTINTQHFDILTFSSLTHNGELIIKLSEKSKDIYEKFLNRKITEDGLIDSFFNLYSLQNGYLYEKYSLDKNSNTYLGITEMYGLLKRHSTIKFNFNTNRETIIDVFNDYQKLIPKCYIILKNGFLQIHEKNKITNDLIKRSIDKLNDTSYNVDLNNFNDLIAYIIYCKRLDPTNSYITDLYRNITNIKEDPKLRIYSMNKIFNPIIGVENYNDEELESLSYIYNIPFFPREDFSYRIQMIYLTEKLFYSPHEAYCDISDDHLSLIEYDNMNKLDLKRIVFYGLKDSLVPMDIMDLLGSFSSKRKFLNPYKDSECFSVFAVTKLSKVVGNFRLKKIIEEIVKENNLINTNISEFKIDYDNYNKEQKNICKSFFEMFLRLGFFMRGWDENNTFPLLSEDCNGKEQSEIDINCSNEFSLINTLLNKNISIKNRLINLPLVNKSGNNDFNVTYGNGRDSIKDILDIVFSERREVEINSCIRMSSNYICETSYFYINKILNMKEPFDINKLQYIS